jgi:hypothetical protein
MFWQVIWVVVGRTQHQAFLLREKGDQLYVKWASSLAKEWVDACDVVDFGESRRRAASCEPVPPEGKERSQPRAARAARKKKDYRLDEEDKEEFDCGLPNKDDKEVEAVAEKPKQKRDKLKSSRKSAEGALESTDEEGTASLSREIVARNKKKRKEKRKNDSDVYYEENRKRPRTVSTPPVYRNPDEVIPQEKPVVAPERIDPTTMPPKAQKNTNNFSWEQSDVLAGKAVAKVCIFLCVLDVLWIIMSTF